jgi:hypothetical protein
MEANIALAGQTSSGIEGPHLVTRFLFLVVASAILVGWSITAQLNLKNP